MLFIEKRYHLAIAEERNLGGAQDQQV